MSGPIPTANQRLRGIAVAQPTLDEDAYMALADTIEVAWDLAAILHRDQKVPGTGLPYLKHLGMVTFEIFAAHAIEPIDNLRLAILCAILHDSVEDQNASLTLIGNRFGMSVAAGVQALSKDPSLPKSEAMSDSLRRITAEPKAVWCVKLADRIANLQGAPPNWGKAKIERYRQEAVLILEALAPANSVLARRLARQIERYPERPLVEKGERT